jgi:hypothetical protein
MQEIVMVVVGMEEKLMQSNVVSQYNDKNLLGFYAWGRAPQWGYSQNKGQ